MGGKDHRVLLCFTTTREERPTDLDMGSELQPTTRVTQPTAQLPAHSPRTQRCHGHFVMCV